MDMLTLIAQTAPPDSNISGTAVVGIIGAITTLVVGIIGKLKLDQVKSESRDVTLKPPVPTVRTQEEPEFVTMAVFNGHLKRIEESIAGIETALESERGIARTANGNIHHRIDALSERLGDRLSKLEGTLEGVAQTSRTLLDLALGRTGNPPKRPQ